MQIKTIIAQFYGEDAVIRNFGSDPKWLQLHVESNSQPAHDTYDLCLGQLLCRIERQSISLTIRRRGTRIRGHAKIAYRQGVVI